MKTPLGYFLLVLQGIIGSSCSQRKLGLASTVRMFRNPSCNHVAAKVRSYGSNTQSNHNAVNELAKVSAIHTQVGFMCVFIARLL